MHFFNPEPLMPLVELSAACRPAQRLSTPFTNFPTGSANRQLAKELAGIHGQPDSGDDNEAFFVLAEGIATAEEVEQGMRLRANQPIGPLALADLVGLDVYLAVLEVLAKGPGIRNMVPALASRTGGRRTAPPQDLARSLPLRLIHARARGVDAHITRGTLVLHRLVNGQRIQPEMSRHPFHLFLLGRRSLILQAPQTPAMQE